MVVLKLRLRSFVDIAATTYTETTEFTLFNLNEGIHFVNTN